MLQTIRLDTAALRSRTAFISSKLRCDRAGLEWILGTSFSRSCITLKAHSSSRFIQDVGKCFAEIKTEELQQRVNHGISGCAFWFA